MHCQPWENWVKNDPRSCERNLEAWKKKSGLVPGFISYIKTLTFVAFFKIVWQSKSSSPLFNAFRMGEAITQPIYKISPRQWETDNQIYLRFNLHVHRMSLASKLYKAEYTKSKLKTHRVVFCRQVPSLSFNLPLILYCKTKNS